MKYNITIEKKEVEFYSPVGIHPGDVLNVGGCQFRVDERLFEFQLAQRTNDECLVKIHLEGEVL